MPQAVEARELGQHYRAVKARLNKGRRFQKIRIVQIGKAVAIPINRILRAPVLERELTVTEVLKLVAEYYGVSVLDIKSQRRHGPIIRPRQVAMYLSRFHTPCSYPHIGKHIGGRDHTTVMYAVESITKKMTLDSGLAQEIQAIAAKLEYLSGRADAS